MVPGLLVGFLAFSAVLVYVVDFRAYRAGRLDGWLQREAELEDEERLLEAPV